MPRCNRCGTHRCTAGKGRHRWRRRKRRKAAGCGGGVWPGSRALASAAAGECLHGQLEPPKPHSGAEGAGAEADEQRLPPEAHGANAGDANTVVAAAMATDGRAVENRSAVRAPVHGVGQRSADRRASRGPSAGRDERWVHAPPSPQEGGQGRPAWTELLTQMTERKKLRDRSHQDIEGEPNIKLWHFSAAWSSNPTTISHF